MTVCLDLESFIKLRRWYVSQKVLTARCDNYELKSPTKRKFPYFDIWTSNVSPRKITWNVTFVRVIGAALKTFFLTKTQLQTRYLKIVWRCCPYHSSKYVCPSVFIKRRVLPPCQFLSYINGEYINQWGSDHWKKIFKSWEKIQIMKMSTLSFTILVSTSNLFLIEWIHVFFYKQQFYKQRQTEAGKKLRKSKVTLWDWTFATGKLFVSFFQVIMQK